MAIVLAAEVGHSLDELGIRRREAALVPADIVFKASPAMSAELERPAVDLDLMPADTGPRPCRLRHQFRELFDFEFEHVAQGGHRVLDAEYELDVQRRCDQAFLHELQRLVEHRYVEDFDLRLDAVIAHLARELPNERRRILVN